MKSSGGRGTVRECARVCLCLCVREKERERERERQCDDTTFSNRTYFVRARVLSLIFSSYRQGAKTKTSRAAGESKMRPFNSRTVS